MLKGNICLLITFQVNKCKTHLKSFSAFWKYCFIRNFQIIRLFSLCQNISSMFYSPSSSKSIQLRFHQTLGKTLLNSTWTFSLSKSIRSLMRSLSNFLHCRNWKKKSQHLGFRFPLIRQQKLERRSIIWRCSMLQGTLFKKSKRTAVFNYVDLIWNTYRRK
jgi:hypothetical protein